ncbi:MAG: glycosyltransferase [Nitrospiraceae bacterium]
MRSLQEPVPNPAEQTDRSDHEQDAALATGARASVPQYRIGGYTAERRTLFDALAPERDHIKSRHRYYYRLLSQLLQFMVPPGQRVLEVGCGTGDLLEAVKPALGVGLDLSGRMLRIARRKFPHLRFVQGDAHRPAMSGTFDYIILSDLAGDLEDVQEVFTRLRPLAGPETRLIITYYNYLWEPILRLAERLALKSPQNVQNWLPVDDIEGFLSLAGFATIRKGYRHLLPVYVPGLSWFCNKVLAHLPGLRRLCLTQYLIARAGRERTPRREYRCSVIVPCRNEAGNIAEIVRRTPTLGAGTELIFVDGNSTDGTVAVIQETIARYQGPHTLRLIHQGEGIGKGDAVRKGFDAATGEVLMILDADVTVDPETLPKFYKAIAEGHGEFVNGSRLVYPMQSQAMRWLNLLGNKFFSMVFTWLLEQRLRDTLCGTKVLLKRNYQKIKAGRHYFGDFDPFGDFDLLFGAAKQNMKIVEVPIRYRDRTYGETKIQRFRHGFLLLRMCWVAYKRFRMC